MYGALQIAGDVFGIILLVGGSIMIPIGAYLSGQPFDHEGDGGGGC